MRRARCVTLLLLSCGLQEVELRPVSALGGADAGAPLEPTPGGPAAPASGESGAASNGANGGASSEPPAGSGCTKVDFLFVVDNSLSMLLKQSNLINSFPGFLRVVQANVEASDFHIMVVDTDGWDGSDADASGSERCRDTLGGGKRVSAAGEDCGVSGDARYLSSAQPDLAETFSCIARVGTFGESEEQPMDALLQAIGRAQNGPGGCNEGFLRDDAILVVTLITDSDDRASIGNPATWRQELLARKSDADAALVVLGLVGDNNLDEGLPGGPCSFLGASGAPALQSFVQSLEQGFLASVCADDYAPFFEDAVSRIDTACRAFVPPLIQ
jgi:hypothetical protein